MDYVHYVSRRVTLRLPARLPNDDVRAGVHNTRGGFAGPEYHQTHQVAWPVPEVQAGDTIWLFAQLSSPWGQMPPALDARIEVKRVWTSSDGWRRFDAGLGSTWYPLALADTCLSDLQVVRKDGRVEPLVRTPGAALGQALQSLQCLHADSARRLREHADRVANAPYQFVSYRQLDGTADAFELASALALQGEVVYWDRWALPRRLTERREQVDSITLTRHLHRRLRAAEWVWGVMSPTYLDPTRYAAKEMRVALAQGHFIPWTSS